MIYGARSLFFNEHFLTFGGYGTSGPLNRIASYSPETDEWSQIGVMKSKRPYTAVIEYNNEFLIAGGLYINGDKQNEKCKFDKTELICTYQAPTMNDPGIVFMMSIIYCAIIFLPHKHFFRSLSYVSDRTKLLLKISSFA